MFLDRKFGYTESLDFSIISGYERLTEAQQQKVLKTYDNAYHSSLHLGVKIAMGKAHETAKQVVTEELKTRIVVEQEVPPSIFAGLENCV